MNKFKNVVLAAMVGFAIAAPIGTGTAYADGPTYSNDIIGSYSADTCEGIFMLEHEVPGTIVLESLIDYVVGDVGVESVSGVDPKLDVQIHPGYTVQVSVEAVANGKVIAHREFYLSCDADHNADVYTTPGYHDVNGRLWHTVCEPYSQTTRCFTDIWATQSFLRGGKVVTETGWVFNNLTYLPSARSLWASNPLGNNVEWTAEDGRHWRTECDTATTGRNGCRSYTYNLVVDADGDASMKWVFNNIVRFN